MAITYLTLNSCKAYVISSDLSDYLWKIICSWEWFNKQTLGVQYMRALDSIAGNLAEGFGRYHKKDKEKFYYNARGSLYEAIHWTKKAKERGLLEGKDYEHAMQQLARLPQEIHWLIKITEEKLKK